MDIGHPKYDPTTQDESSAPPAPKILKSKANSSPSAEATGDKESGGRFWLVYTLGLVLVAVLAFFGVRAASGLVDVWTNLSPTPTSIDSKKADTTASTDTSQLADNGSVATPAATTPTTTETTPAATATPTPTPAATPTVDKSTFKIKVLNGGGVSGAADKAKAVLEAAGFKVEATGNAKSFSYASTIVYYVAGKEDNAQQVLDALKDKYQAEKVENNVASGYDALVVIGKK